MMTWMNDVVAERYYVFQKDSAPAHQTRKTQAWLHSNLPYYGSLDLWSSSSSDGNLLDYYMWDVVEAKVNAKPQ